MTRTHVLGILVSLFPFVSGCKTRGILLYKNKSEVRNEYINDGYYDKKTNTSFKKGNYFYFLKKRDLKNATKTELFDLLLKVKEELIPVYAGTNLNSENLPEYIFIYKVSLLSKIDSILLNSFQTLTKFIYNTDYNFKGPDNRLANFYYLHDPQKKSLITVGKIFIPNSNTAYLITYTTHYKDTSKFLQKFYKWDLNNQPGNKYADAITKYGIDTVLQLQGFLPLRHILKTIDSDENRKVYNFFAEAESAFNKKDSNSYYHSIGVLNRLYTDVLRQKENNLLLQEYFQCKATYLSFAGENAEAMKCELEYKNNKNIFSIPQGYEVSNAAVDILAVAKNKKIIAFNESHHDVRCRAFVYALLDSLKNNGFTHLAIEDLREQLSENLNPTSGFYSREPIFNNLIIHAKKIGLKVIAYDFSYNGSVSSQRRDEIAAKNILKKINFDHNEKLVILCGYGHTDKSKSIWADFLLLII